MSKNTKKEKRIVLNKEIIIDTGFFVALFSNTDQFHKHALNLRKLIDKKKWITTWPVLTETCHLLSARGFSHVIQNLLKLHEQGGFELFYISNLHVSQIIKLLIKYEELPMDLADASLVILAEELKHGDIVSTDSRDFQTYRWKNHQPFNNLFEKAAKKLK